jgi:hypothetical protein
MFPIDVAGYFISYRGLCSEMRKCSQRKYALEKCSMEIKFETLGISASFYINLLRRCDVLCYIRLT